jgi:hypothetical protein
MLKSITLLFALVTFPALACTNLFVEGKLAVDGQTWKFGQKLRGLGKEDSFQVGPYLIAMTLTFPDKGYRVRYKIEEKKGLTLTMVTHGEEDEIELNKTRDIMARGLEGQPNSIITLKLKDI